MKKFFGIILGGYCWLVAGIVSAADKFDILPDLPEPLAGSMAQASSVSTTDTATNVATQTVGHEPNFVSILFSLIFVVLLIYATGIIYTKLNKLGFATLKKQMGDLNKSQVSVISTTALGNNKSLHIVELDGKRMLIGASINSIHLIKDLGAYPPAEIEEGEYSKIEIPNIRIPKIEIPRIEIPNIGFSKIVTKAHPAKEDIEQEAEDVEDDKFEITDIYEEENSDGIIDKLFQTAQSENPSEEPVQPENEHKVDPDDFALYKKYL